MCPVSLQDKVAIVNIQWILNSSINGFGSDGIEFIDEIPDSSHIKHSNFIFRTPNLLCFIDMMNMLDVNDDDRILYIDEDFTTPSTDEIVEVNRNQYIAEITRIIESHDATWNSYHQTQIQHSNPLDIDDHTISSIERI